MDGGGVRVWFTVLVLQTLTVRESQGLTWSLAWGLAWGGAIVGFTILMLLALSVRDDP